MRGWVRESVAEKVWLRRGVGGLTEKDGSRYNAQFDENVHKSRSGSLKNIVSLLYQSCQYFVS